MARLPRIHLPHIPQHIIQRGNNHCACFASSEDFKAYIHWLKEYAQQYSVDVHAWVLMTNHVHLLCTPRETGAISQLMQSLGRRYVQYFNNRYKRTGTLWEGRYKSCLIQEELYLLHVYRYIELNPVRAAMVLEPAEYSWSSYQINALGKKSDLCSPHSEYIKLGANDIQRQSNYQELFKVHIEAAVIEGVRSSLNKGLALGNEHFKLEVEQLSGRRVKAGKRGRPAGWRKPAG